MGYYRILNLAKEPFSNSPDPGLFFNSKQHLESLQQLEISIRLKRGLSIITGEVGTGKTTLSRQLIQRFSKDEAIQTIIILDPGYANVADFLAYILQLLTGAEASGSTDENWLKEQIKNHLFTQSVEQERLTVLIIDEGQKLTIPCLEALRELLNYETNDHKLLQIVIFAQKELDAIINQMENFKDRINFYYTLGALDFKDTRGLINYRLEQSFEPGKQSPIFSFAASVALYRASGGYPRKIVKLCHHVLLSLIVQNRNRAGFFLVRACIKKMALGSKPPGRLVQGFSLLFLMLLVTGVGFYFSKNNLTVSGNGNQKSIEPSLSVKEASASVSFNIPEKKPIQAKSLPAKTPHDLKNEEKSTRFQGGSIEPKLLGSLTVGDNELLSDMAKGIYGSFRYGIIDEILDENRHIINPNLIHAGSKIRFPVPNFSFKAETENLAAIILSKEDSLEKAYALVKQYKTADFSIKPDGSKMGMLDPITRYSQFESIPIRILAAWNPGEGLQFYVVINRFFPGVIEAETYLNRLPRTLPGRIDLLSSWTKETRIYAKRSQ